MSRAKASVALILCLVVLTSGGCTREAQRDGSTEVTPQDTARRPQAVQSDRATEHATSARAKPATAPLTATRADKSFRRAVVDGAPERFTIVPDDYHVPWAGTAGDGRRFFLSDELFDVGPDDQTAWVGLFLWKADGTFDEVRVQRVGAKNARPEAADYRAAIDARLAELGECELEPIDVEPFTVEVAGVTFGWEVDSFEGELSILVAPGDFIAYYEPWDGLEYDT